MAFNDIEIWKPVVGLENYYEVSSWGQVRIKEGATRKLADGRTVIYPQKPVTQHLHQAAGPNMRYIVMLQGEKERKKHYVHRLVALAFIPCDNPDEMQVNHIDGNPLNNRLENLEWVTHDENLRHAATAGLIGSRKPITLVSEDEGEILSFPSQGLAADFLGRSNSYIRRRAGKENCIFEGVDGRRWTAIEQPEPNGGVDLSSLSDADRADPHFITNPEEIERTRTLIIRSYSRKRAEAQKALRANPENEELQKELTEIDFFIRKMRMETLGPVFQYIPGVPYHCGNEEFERLLRESSEENREKDIGNTLLR